MNERVFTLRGEGVSEATHQALFSKATVNRARGESVLQTGVIEPFSGYNKDAFVSQHGYILELDNRSSERVLGEVVSPLRLIAKEHGIKAVFPNDGDLPPHITIQTVKYNGLTTHEMEHMTEMLNEDRYLQKIGQVLAGIPFDLKALVFTGRDTILCADRYTEKLNPVIKAKKLLGEVYALAGKRAGIPLSEVPGGFGIEPFGYHDIFHTTVMRVTAPCDAEVLQSFYKTIVPLQKSLDLSPLSFHTGGIFLGTSYDYVEKHLSAVKM